MTLVERFIDFTDWPTSRKTAFLASVAAISQLVNTGILMWLRPAAVDLPVLAKILLGGGVVSVGVVVVSWISYRRGSEGRWTGYLLTVTFAACVDAFAISQGLLVTPIIAVALLVPLLVAVIYDVRMATASLACYAIPLLGAAVLVLADAIPFAPTMAIRDIDGLKSASYFAFVLLILTVVSAAVYLSGFMAVAAAGLQRRRLRETHARLERAHGLIRRYVPEQVADAVLSDVPEAIERHERRKLTIFFSDLVGFTDLSDEMEPEDLATVLHDYFTEMSAIARKHAGTVDDLIGDAVLVLFGAPDFTDDRDQALRAVRMAVEMQQAMGALNQRWASAGIPNTLTVRMGINTGVATVGNFGSAERTKYTALGKQVNIAARIQARCEPGKVLIGHTTWLLVRDEISCTPKGELELKGLRKTMPAYEVTTTPD